MGFQFQKAARMLGVESSPTVRLNAMAQEMIKSGKDIINLTAGETDFETPAVIREAATASMNAGFTRYTAPSGTLELRKAAAKWFERDFSLKYSPAQITVSCGVKQGIFNLILATINPGDEVLIPAPYWVSYPEMVRLAGGVPIFIPPADHFGLSVAGIEKKLSPKTKLLLLNFPNNPSGAMATKEQLQSTANLLVGSQVLVASDEIYSSLVYDSNSFVPFAGLSSDAYERTITFNGLSKSHAMTGWRVGFAAGSTAIIDAMSILQAQSATNITSFVQPAAVIALEQSPTDFVPKLKEMQERRDLCWRAFSQMPGVKCEKPQGAFYLFPNMSAYFEKSFAGKKIVDSSGLAEFLLQEAGVALVPGKPFGDDACIRISFAKDKKSLESAIDRIRKALLLLQ